MAASTPLCLRMKSPLRLSIMKSMPAKVTAITGKTRPLATAPKKPPAR